MDPANNPYSPPKADPGSGPAGEQPLLRPRAVDNAVILIAIHALLTAFDALGSWNQFQTGAMNGIMFLEQWVRLGLLVWICFAMPRGKNWARILLLILTLLVLFGLVMAFMAWRRMGMSYAYFENGPRFLFMISLPSVLSIAAC